MSELRKVHEPFVYAALGIGLTAGLGFGGYLVLARLFGAPLGGWYGALVQAHGHAELFGWMVLFMLGVGLFFLPRLRGTNLVQPQRTLLGLGLLGAGIALHSVAQPLAGYVGSSVILRSALLLSAGLEVAGLGVLIWLLIKTLRGAKPLTAESPALTVEGFMQLAFLSLAVAFVVNLLGAWNAVSQGKYLWAARYDQLGITCLLYGAAVPMTFVFAIRTLPLYLKIVMSERKHWQTLVVVYFVGLVLRVVPYVLAVADDAILLTGRLLRANYVYVLLTDVLAVLGIVMLNVCILVGIWRLNWFKKREVGAGEGEYGAFHLLIYSAYIWLMVACVLDMLRALPIVNELLPIQQDAARHALMAGFITLIIFGMGVRMLPGLSGKRALALPRLVLVIFVLGNLAAGLRVGAPIFASGSSETGLTAVSGVVGWVAMLLFAVMVVGTFRQKSVL